MKTYLNANERMHSAHLMLCINGSQKLLDNPGISKEERTNLKYIHTYAKKWWAALLKRVGIEEQQRIQRMFTDMKPVLESKRKEARKLPISDEVVGNMLELFIEVFCKNCDLSDADCTTCPVFQMNQDMNIMVTANPEEGFCPYRYKEGEDIKND